MARLINPFGKTRNQDAPYAIFQSPNGQWEWRVLKTYKHPKNEVKDPFARWFVAAKSPHTFGEFELGDSYARRNSYDLGIADIGVLRACTQEWLDLFHEGREFVRGVKVEILK